MNAIAGLLITGVAHRGDEVRARRALEHVDHVLLAVPGGADSARRIAAASAMRDRYLPAGRTAVISVGDTEDAGAVLRHAGATVVVGVEPAGAPAVIRCLICGIVTAASCGHGGESPDEAAARAVAAPGPLPADLFRPEVAAVLGRPVSDGRARSGAILWFTGMSGAGKSTLSQALAAHLTGVVPLEVLDGDEVREHMSKGLSFSREDRDINVRRIAFVARTLARHGVVVITAAISPYATTRDEARQLAQKAGVVFVEIYARAELSSLVARDVKGLYKRALANEIPHFTGVSDPYEAPTAADIEAYTDREPVEVSTARILAALRDRGIVPA